MIVIRKTPHWQSHWLREEICDTFVPYKDEEEVPVVSLKADVCKDDRAQINAKWLQDLLISAEVILAHKDAQKVVIVVRRCVDDSGNLVGLYHENPTLNF